MNQIVKGRQKKKSSQWQIIIQKSRVAQNNGQTSEGSDMRFLFTTFTGPFRDKPQLQYNTWPLRVKRKKKALQFMKLKTMQRYEYDSMTGM